MKFVITFSFKEGRTEQDREDERKVFRAWEPDPSVTFHQFVQRLDASGVAVVETDDLAPLLTTVALFGRWITFAIDPVMDVDALGPVVDKARGQVAAALGKTGPDEG